MRTSLRRIAPQVLMGVALAPFGLADCSAMSTQRVQAADATQFSPERFATNLRALARFGARSMGSEAVAKARTWAAARVPVTQAGATVVLSAPLLTRAVSGSALVEEGSGAALVLEAARTLAARGERVAVELDAGEIASAPALAGAALVVYVRRGCSLPQRRDLLSHRVLRERFFRAANTAPTEFEQADAPHAAMLAAGAKRVVALDGPALPGGLCEPAAFGDALVRFVSDATQLLARGRTNFAPPPASEEPHQGAIAP